MGKVTANNGKENYFIELQTLTGNTILADEAVENGGQDKGFSPKELLESSLAACTSATVRLFAHRKGWHLKNVHIQVELMEDNGKSTLNRKIFFDGSLDDEQRKTLLAVANACPVHKILTQPIIIDTSVV